MINIKKTKKEAFSLIELLLVLAIITILAGIVIISINPGRQLAKTRNTQRANDIFSIYSSVMQYYIDNQVWPNDELPTDLQDICKQNIEEENNDCINLDLLVPTYLPEVPYDPIEKSNLTGYQIAISNYNTPVLFAVNSMEYDLPVVQIGDIKSTTGPRISTCGEGENCWSAEQDRLGWVEAKTFCSQLTEGGVLAGTWFLPTKNQLSEGWENLGPDYFIDDIYWSSTEYEDDSSMVWILNTDLKEMDVYAKDSSGSDFSEYVRCTR